MSQLFVFCCKYFCVCDGSGEMKNWLTTTGISTITWWESSSAENSVCR